MSTLLSPRSANAGRIVLDTFRSSYDPMLRSWLLFRSQILPEVTGALPAVPSEPDDGQERTRTGQFGVWRMLASNNRELGRGAGLYATPLEALVAAEQLQRDAADLVPAVVRGAQPMTHGWVLRHAGAGAMTSSRWYESASEAASAARRVRAALAGATIATGVNIGTHSGRRLRRDLGPPGVLV